MALKARIDPAFTQSPSNPLAVTYAYSASATENPYAGVERPVALPPGILNLYSDGSLECSLNVGGTVTGGSCPVTYSGFGAHRVIVDYLSGEASATETSIEQINAYTTTTTLALSAPRECLTEPELERCTYAAETGTVDQNGNSPAAGEMGLSFDVPGEEFAYGFSPQELGQPGPTFLSPVTFTVTRSHTETGWECTISAYGKVKHLGELSPPWGKYSSKCATTLLVRADYDDFPSEHWTSSESAATPVTF